MKWSLLFACVCSLAVQAQVFTPAPLVMDQWGIGVGGPQTMPHAEPNPGLFEAVEA